MIVAAMVSLAACNSKWESGATLGLSQYEAVFEPAASTIEVAVTTNQSVWRADTDAKWFTLSRDEHTGNLLINAPVNQRKQERTGIIYISAGGAYQRILVKQQAPENVYYQVGDPWPDNIDPQGVIYKLLDQNGEHGMVVSLTTEVASWGAAATSEGAASLIDGKANTQAVIAARMGQANFTTAYQAFAWVHELNGEDPDGAWYLPAYYEVQEMIHALFGSAYTMPDPAPAPATMVSANCVTAAQRTDPEQAQMINDALVDNGGTALDFGTSSTVWSSSEVSATNVYVVGLGPSYMGSVSMASYGKAAWDGFVRTMPVRAIMKF